MRANEDVDLSLLDLLDDFLLLLRRAEAAKHLDGDGKSGEATFEGFEMLEGKDSRWRKDCDLPVILNSLEGCTHSNFRLAVANVSAEQAVHRHGGLHILLDVGDRGNLIVSLVVIEGILELALPLSIHRVAVALRHLALGVQFEQFVGHVAHGLFYPGLCLCPLCAAQSAKWRACALSRTVLLNEVEPRERH